MNLLAHLHLSQGCPPEVLTANVMADYLGRYDPVEDMSPKFAARLMPGILLHRQIDSFTDQHPATKEARALVSVGRRRLSGIIVDIVFDYYLSRHWGRFCEEERSQFVSRGYATMSMVAAAGFNDETRSIIAKMRTTDWLTAYGTVEGQARTFQRVSRRSEAVSKLIGAEEEFTSQDAEFESCFLKFYPELCHHAESWKTENLGNF